MGSIILYYLSFLYLLFCLFSFLIVLFCKSFAHATTNTHIHVVLLQYCKTLYICFIETFRKKKYFELKTVHV